jgi:hypothetical protein
MATMNTLKHRAVEDDDCFMDDVGNEGINLIGVASDRSDEELCTSETPVEHLKIDPNSVRKSKGQHFSWKKSTSSNNKARGRYQDEDDNVYLDTEEEAYSKPNLHLG